MPLHGFTFGKPLPWNLNLFSLEALQEWGMVPQDGGTSYENLISLSSVTAFRLRKIKFTMLRFRGFID